MNRTTADERALLRPDRFGEKIEQTHKGDSAFLSLWKSMSGGKPKDAA